MTELLNYIDDPKNAMYNFSLARWYEEQGHTAAAAGYYVRTAEYSSEDLLSYEALLRLAICFTKQGSRNFVVKGLYLRAISLMPHRSEAYFLLSQCYEHCKDWQEAYTFASLGENLDFQEKSSLQTNVGYPGLYGFTFEKAVAGWWIGLYDESLHLFRQLKKNANMQFTHVQAVNSNLKNLGGTVWHEPIIYYNSMHERLKIKFPGSVNIQRNYSQCYQDMFVLTMLDGKKDGIFFEIGCGDPFFGNNTALLEEWGWKGTSIDIDPVVTEKFHKERKSFVITGDATKLDYDKLIICNYDYLQIDCDPALNSLQVLLKIPFDKRKFAIITFEHDAYCSEGILERSRSYLRSFGYILIAGNIAPDKYCNFEDWWIHPDLVCSTIINKMQRSSNTTIKADNFMLNK